MAVGGNNPYPAISTVTNLVRTMVQDDMAGATATLGEGQIFVDNVAISVTMMNAFSSALRTVARKLRIVDGPMLIKDNILVLGIPPMTSPTYGGAAPDPSVQVYLGYTGYFDGTQMWSNYVLPIDCMRVDRVWERINGTNDDFQPMANPRNGLASTMQDVYNCEWEWRQDRINMRGSLQTMDLRLRYFALLPTLWTAGVDVTQTYIPINDCVETLAAFIIQILGMRQGTGPIVTQQALEWANEQVNDFLNECIKQEQGIPYEVREFDPDDFGIYSAYS